MDARDEALRQIADIARAHGLSAADIAGVIEAPRGDESRSSGVLVSLRQAHPAWQVSDPEKSTSSRRCAFNAKKGAPRIPVGPKGA